MTGGVFQPRTWIAGLALERLVPFGIATNQLKYAPDERNDNMPAQLEPKRQAESLFNVAAHC